MANVELISFGTPGALAEAAGRAWLAEIEKHGKPKYLVALSGGRLAGRFFRTFAGLAAGAQEILGTVHFFWSDERCVPPDHPESNYKIARESLFEPLAIDKNRIHRLQGEEQPDTAAREGEALLRRLALASATAPPVLDLVFLGLGEDGHVASLFPFEDERLAKSDAVYRAVIAPKPPPKRITMGYGTIAAAHDVWVLASGEGKTMALQESLASGGRTPLAHVLCLRQHTRIFTDIKGV